MIDLSSGAMKAERMGRTAPPVTVRDAAIGGGGVDLTLDRAALALAQTAHLRSMILNRHIRGDGITFSQWHALECIACAAFVRPSDLARKLGIGKVAAGNMAQRLVRSGWVVEGHVSDDSRSKALRITPDGKVLLERVRARLSRVNDRIEQTLSDEQRETLERLLSLMKVRLQDLAHDAGEANCNWRRRCPSPEAS